jgi:hypothetical protein
MGQDEPRGASSLRPIKSKASRRMSCLQSAPHDSACGIPGRERQAIHRLGHQAARQGWRQGGLPYLAERGVLPCYVGFFPRPPRGAWSFRLSLPNTMRGAKRVINCWDGGMSSNCPNWSDRHFFLRVLIGISYDLRIFGIPRVFSDGIRPGNAVRLKATL